MTRSREEAPQVFVEDAVFSFSPCARCACGHLLQGLHAEMDIDRSLHLNERETLAFETNFLRKRHTASLTTKVIKSLNRNFTEIRFGASLGEFIVSEFLNPADFFTFFCCRENLI
jgi:hypothetical protein